MRYYSSTASSKVLDITISNSATQITLNNLTGLPVNYPYTLVLEPDTSSEEIVLVTSLASGTTLNIVRGANTDNGVVGGDGTSARAHDAGSVVKHMVTARDLQEPQNHIAASTLVHGLGAGEGAVVGVDKTQTLTNKTLTSPTINNPTITGTIVLPSTTSIGSVDSTEIGYLNGVTSAVQTQLDAKAATSHTHGNITSDGKIGSTANRLVQTTTSGTLTTVTGTNQSGSTYLAGDLTWKTATPSTNSYSLSYSTGWSLSTGSIKSYGSVVSFQMTVNYNDSSTISFDANGDASGSYIRIGTLPSEIRPSSGDWVNLIMLNQGEVFPPIFAQITPVQGWIDIFSGPVSKSFTGSVTKSFTLCGTYIV